MQVQRRHARANLHDLQQRRAGLLAAVAFTVAVAVLDVSLGFMTVLHEYGHVWAARLAGNRVAAIQVDFLDRTSDFFDTAAGIDLGSDTVAGIDATDDGRLGFVLYEPIEVLEARESFDNITAFNSFAGANFALPFNDIFVLRLPGIVGRDPLAGLVQSRRAWREDLRCPSSALPAPCSLRPRLRRRWRYLWTNVLH